MARFRSALSAVAGLVMAAGVSSAARADLLPFAINPVSIGGTNASYTADALNFSTVAVVSQTGVGTQTETGYAQVNALTLAGNTVIPNGGLDNTWLIYVTYTATVSLGSFAPGSSGPVTTFAYDMYADIGVNDTYNNTGNSHGAAIGTVTNTGGDILLASGTETGSGNTAGFNSHGGPEFSVLANFDLTAAGDAVFVSPSPFYQFVFAASTSSQGGNVSAPGAFGLNPNQVAISSDINSSFEVPEPSTLVLFGSALIGLGALSKWRPRRKQQPKPV